MENKKRPVTLSLDEDIYKEFQKYCLDIGKKPSKVITDLMEDTLSNLKKKKK